jgi:hypothetical protein
MADSNDGRARSRTARPFSTYEKVVSRLSSWHRKAIEAILWDSEWNCS